jgi:hypothetical protein
MRIRGKNTWCLVNFFYVHLKGHFNLSKKTECKFHYRLIFRTESFFIRDRLDLGFINTDQKRKLISTIL